jgi:hypothetical protein
MRKWKRKGGRGGRMNEKVEERRWKRRTNERERWRE